jgi:dephospho-CoA kinase
LNILRFNGQVDRQKLGAHVFSNPEALRRLERIVHPAVNARIKEILSETDAPVVVIEAIKLVEAGLHTWCDAVWVVTAAPEKQIERVMRDRHMSEEDARARLDAQGSLDEKLRLANIVIDNSGDENATRVQVQRAWNAIKPKAARDKTEWFFGATPAPAKVPPAPPATFGTVVTPAELEIRPARKNDVDALGKAFAKREGLTEPLPRAELLKRFGMHGYRIAAMKDRVAAFIAWDAENLVVVVREAWAESAPVAAQALPKLFAMIEDEAKKLQCEVILLLIDPLVPPFVKEQARGSEYQPRNLQELHPVWRQVAFDRLQSEDEIWVKRLREELVRQPF